MSVYRCLSRANRRNKRRDNYETAVIKPIEQTLGARFSAANNQNRIRKPFVTLSTPEGSVESVRPSTEISSVNCFLDDLRILLPRQLAVIDFPKYDYAAMKKGKDDDDDDDDDLLPSSQSTIFDSKILANRATQTNGGKKENRFSVYLIR